MEKYGVNEENTGLSLYSKKILIKQKCTELLPNYFRFVKGVVDCSDIPLSISRESYQDSNLIFKLRVLITKRLIKKLEEQVRDKIMDIGENEDCDNISFNSLNRTTCFIPN